MSDGVVVRLQAAIEQRALIALAATQKRWVLRDFDDDHAMSAKAVAVEGADEDPSHDQIVAVTLYQAPRVVGIDDQRWDENAAHIAVNDPQAVLRLCQSHRDILDAWPDVMGQWNGEQADAARRMKDLIVRHLARGYGIED